MGQPSPTANRFGGPFRGFSRGFFRLSGAAAAAGNPRADLVQDIDLERFCAIEDRFAVPTTPDAPLWRPASYAQAIDSSDIFARQGPAGGFGTLTPGWGTPRQGAPGAFSGNSRKVRCAWRSGGRVGTGRASAMATVGSGLPHARTRARGRSGREGVEAGLFPRALKCPRGGVYKRARPGPRSPPKFTTVHSNLERDQGCIHG